MNLNHRFIIRTLSKIVAIGSALYLGFYDEIIGQPGPHFRFRTVSHVPMAPYWVFLCAVAAFRGFR